MMSDSMRKSAQRKMEQDEGRKKFPYLDQFNNITIAVGYNLSARGVSEKFIDDTLNDDLDFFYNSLNRDYPWFSSLTEPRKIVLINLCFMGYKKFQEFTKMLYCLSIEDYAGAAAEIENSLWATEVQSSRVNQNAETIRTGNSTWEF